MPPIISAVPTKKFISNLVFSNKDANNEPNIKLKDKYIGQATWYWTLVLALNCHKIIPMRLTIIPEIVKSNSWLVMELFWKNIKKKPKKFPFLSK